MYMYVYADMSNPPIPTLRVNVLKTITSNEFKILKEFVAYDDFSEFYEHVKWFGLKKIFMPIRRKLIIVLLLNVNAAPKVFFFIDQ